MQRLERLALVFTTAVATFLIVATPWGFGQGGNWYCVSKVDKEASDTCQDCGSSGGQMDCRGEAMPPAEYTVGECDVDGPQNSSIRCEMYANASCGDQHRCDTGARIGTCDGTQNFVRILPGSACPKQPTPP